MRLWLLLLLAGLGISSAVAQAPAAAPDSDLVFTLILSRHGIRSPLLKNEEMAKYAAEPWPQWEVAAGILTPHGRRVMELMGEYYRAYYTAAGLLSGDAARDASQIYFRSDASERTINTSKALGEGLLGGRAVPVHALPMTNAHSGDPLLDPDTPLERTSSPLRTASLQGRIGDDSRLLVDENRLTLDALERVLFGGDGTAPAGKTAIAEVPAAGLWQAAQRVVDALTLEYADGKPLAEVGWGRLHPADLPQIMTLSELNFDLTWRTPLHARAAASNLASHLLATLEQAARQQAVSGAIGGPGQRLVVVVGHDSNIMPLARLLEIDWAVPGAPQTPFLPGGALVFELRHRRSDGQFLVRTRYVSPTIEQSRAALPFTLEHPPATAAIFVPDCSLPDPGYDAPLDLFAAHVRAALDPKKIVPEPAAVR
jgi:4-phytase/acid phosphatase